MYSSSIAGRRSLEGNPQLRWRGFATLAAIPDLFRRMLSTHIGTASPAETLGTLGKELLFSTR